MLFVLLLVSAERHRQQVGLTDRRLGEHKASDRYATYEGGTQGPLYDELLLSCRVPASADAFTARRRGTEV